MICKLRRARKASMRGGQLAEYTGKENISYTLWQLTNRGYIAYILIPSTGLVCKIYNGTVGFAGPDLQDNNIRVLFILPGYEKLGIFVCQLVCDWCFISDLLK